LGVWPAWHFEKEVVSYQRPLRHYLTGARTTVALRFRHSRGEKPYN
jgi:hypothetical protein